MLENTGEVTWPDSNAEENTELKLDEEEMPLPTSVKIPWCSLHPKGICTHTHTPFNWGCWESGEGHTPATALSPSMEQI